MELPQSAALAIRTASDIFLIRKDFVIKGIYAILAFVSEVPFIGADPFYARAVL
jgi:hypothetical protein